MNVETKNMGTVLTVESKQKEYEELKKRYKTQKKKGFWMGIIFLFSSIFFSIIGFLTQNYNVFYGVILQLLAGVVLVFNNRN